MKELIFFWLYRDTGDTERVFEHDIQHHAKIHIIEYGCRDKRKGEKSLWGSITVQQQAKNTKRFEE